MNTNCPKEGDIRHTAVSRAPSAQCHCDVEKGHTGAPLPPVPFFTPRPAQMNIGHVTTFPMFRRRRHWRTYLGCSMQHSNAYCTSSDTPPPGTLRDCMGGGGAPPRRTASQPILPTLGPSR
jgi:hypothetical protein